MKASISLVNRWQCLSGSKLSSDHFIITKWSNYKNTWTNSLLSAIERSSHAVDRPHFGPIHLIDNLLRNTYLPFFCSSNIDYEVLVALLIMCKLFSHIRGTRLPRSTCSLWLFCLIVSVFFIWTVLSQIILSLLFKLWAERVYE